ncbi:MAG: hypothetical protein ACLFWD_02285 [Anaerolineales bacterium]
MEHTAEISFKLQSLKMLGLLNDSDNLAELQDSRVSFEHLQGEPGKPGAKSKLESKWKPPAPDNG